MQEQDYPSVEHLVIDGGSQDGTLEILRRYRHLVWISESDDGQADAVNKGLRLAKGEILGWLNSDDVYVSRAISQVADYFLAHTEVDVVYGDCYEMDASGRVHRKINAHPVDLEQLLLFDFTLYQPTFFFRRRAVEKIGPLDVTLHLALDYDYIVRTVRSCSVAYLPRPLAGFRRHAKSKTLSQPGGFLPEYLQVLGGVFADPTLPRTLIKLRRRAYSIAHACCAEQLLKAGDVKQARDRLLTALRLCPHPFRWKSAKAALLLFDLLLGIELGAKLIRLTDRLQSHLRVRRSPRAI